MASIEKRVRNGKTTYRVRYRDPAGNQRSKVFGRKVDADRWLLENEASKLKGAWVDPALGKVTVGEWAERWYNATAALKPTTRADYRMLLDHQVLPAFKDMPIAKLDTLAIREWVAGLVSGQSKPCKQCAHGYRAHRDTAPRCGAADGCTCPGWKGGISAKRARKAYQVLSQILDRAVEGKSLVSNPAILKSRDLPQSQKREMHHLDARQVEVLAAAIDPRFSTLVRFLAYTGLRPCELVALKVKRLDLLRGTVRVAEAAPEVRGRQVLGSVKHHEARTIRLPKWLAGEVAALLDGRGGNPEAFVFVAPLGGPVHENSFSERYFKPAIAAANELLAKLPDDARPGLIPATLRLYDLRHTCASLLIREGASVKAVQKHMGHATASITLDTYGHLFPDELDQVAERLDRIHEEALAALPSSGMWPQGGPAVVPLRKAAGQRG